MYTPTAPGSLPALSPAVRAGPSLSHHPVFFSLILLPSVYNCVASFIAHLFTAPYRQFPLGGLACTHGRVRLSFAHHGVPPSRESRVSPGGEGEGGEGKAG